MVCLVHSDCGAQFIISRAFIDWPLRHSINPAPRARHIMHKTSGAIKLQTAPLSPRHRLALRGSGNRRNGHFQWFVCGAIILIFGVDKRWSSAYAERGSRLRPTHRDVLRVDVIYCICSQSFSNFAIYLLHFCFRSFFVCLSAQR